MTEKPEAYIPRILSYVDADPLDIQRATAATLKDLIAGRSRSELEQRPSASAWSVAQILAHLADAEIVAGYRIRMIAAQPECAIPAFDQDAWSENLGYATRDANASIQHFEANRTVNLALLAALTPAQWQNRGIHAERGVETVAHIVRMFAGHDLNHIAQVKKILAVSNPTPL